MCIAKNEEAVAIQPNFPECFNNMANAWRVRPFSQEINGGKVRYYCLCGLLHFSVLLSIAGER
jgi:hypothetical protein